MGERAALGLVRPCPLPFVVVAVVAQTSERDNAEKSSVAATPRGQVAR
jgi:hypothetical protein